MAESVVKSFFPSQVASDIEKMSLDFGLKVGKAIENEWFRMDSGVTRYRSNQHTFHRLRLYSRGEQSIQKYKDELAVNGDLSYLNLDWKVVPIIPKFVDIVVNGISERTFEIKAYSQDPYGVSKRTAYMESILRDMQTKEINDFIESEFGISAYENDRGMLPESKEELDLHMQLSYKQEVEIAEEQAINVLLETNKYELIKKRINYDLVTIGMGAVKNYFSPTEGVKIEYVDPANLVYSYSESPYFDDIYYVGEIRDVPLNELKKQFPELTNEDLKSISEQGFRNNGFYDRSLSNYNESDSNTVQVLYFNFKTYMNEVYKVKETATGATKVLLRDESYNPPLEDLEAKFGKMQRSIEVLFEGVLLLGTDKILKWELAKNMMRPKSDSTRVKMNYSIVAPRMYKGKIESLVSRITGFADMIQITHLKIQQVLSKMVPDGVWLDVDGLAEVDLGNGTTYNAAEALNMFWQTGSVVGRSFTEEGGFNPGKMPIQEITAGAGGNKIPMLIQTYNYYLQMIRDTTGLNEARDGSTPDARALVGLQKMAAANSNTATRHILDSSVYLTSDLAENLSLRVSDILEFSPTAEAFIQKIGGHSTATLAEMTDLHLYDFGIFITLTPDEEEKAKLENNVQTALSAGLIDLDDAIDIREVKNIKLANQLLKLRRKKKLERDQMMQQQNMQAQAESNMQLQEASAQLALQKEQALTMQKSELLKLEASLAEQKLMKEVEAKKQLMEFEFELNRRLKELEADVYKSKESFKEDRKDERTKLQATQQSELIDQRKNGTPPKSFESAGNDVLGGSFDLGMYEPR
jgi:hypothetical protein